MRRPLAAVLLALAACAHAPGTSQARQERAATSREIPRGFDETRAAALEVLRSLAPEVTASAAHLQVDLTRTRTTPEAHVEVWLLTEATDRTVVRVEITRGVVIPGITPDEVREDVLLDRIAARLGLPAQAARRGGRLVESPPELPGGDVRALYGWTLGPLGPPALRAALQVGWHKAFTSALIQDPATGRSAYAHLDEGLRAFVGASIPNDSRGVLDTRLAIGWAVETGQRDLLWRSMPVEVIENVNAGAVRVGVGIVQHFAATAAGRSGFPDVAFRASPGVVAEVGVVVPVRPLRAISSGAVISVRASWIRLSAGGTTFDATSGGFSAGWLF